jgi:hypothetical protein
MARTTHLRWEGGVALETGFRRSQETCSKNAVRTPSRVHALLGVFVSSDYHNPSTSYIMFSKAIMVAARTE